MTLRPANQRVLRETPFIVDHRQIGMADPAVVDPVPRHLPVGVLRVIFIEFDRRPPLWRRSFYYRHCVSFNVVLN